jgi:bifunctional non-homologous end joining protein LigD
VKAKTAYIDGEVCGIDEAGIPSFANPQAATDGERRVQLVYYAFDLLHGQDTSGLLLIERKALLQPLVADKPGLQFNGTRRATANSSCGTRASSVLRAWSRR